MKRALNILGVIASILILCVVGTIVYLYLANRTIDQTLTESLPVSNTWTEITADPPLTASRRTQELALSIPNHTLDRGEKLPSGQIRLPDGRMASPEVEGVDIHGNTVEFRLRGHTLREQDYIVFTPAESMDSRKISKIRIRSAESFTTGQIFWRNRNPK